MDVELAHVGAMSILRIVGLATRGKPSGSQRYSGQYCLKFNNNKNSLLELLCSRNRTPVVFKYPTHKTPSTCNGQQTSSPYLRRYIALMERIQRLAPSMVKSMRELP